MPCNSYPTDQAYDILTPPQQAVSGFQNYPLRPWTAEAIAPKERSLIVSNAPETISRPTTGYEFSFPATLYKCEIDLEADVAKDFRVFFWHVNQFFSSDTGPTVPLSFYLVASTDGDSAAQISQHVRDSGMANAGRDSSNPGNLAPTGICIAKSQLFGGMTTTTPNDSALATSGEDEEETVLGIYTVGLAPTTARPLGTPQSFGALHDFTVTSPVACKLRVRTFVTNQSSVRGSFADSPLQPSNPGGAHSLHIRGWWPQSDLTLFCPSDPYDVSAVNINGSSHIGAYGVIEAQGMEATAFAWQGSTLDPSGTSGGNKGLYGANCHYKITVQNKKASNRSLWIVLHARTTGSVFFGASETTAPDGDDVVSAGQFGIPVIRSSSSDPTDPISEDNAALLIDQATLDPNSTREYTINLAAGGAAGLPASLFVSGESPFGWRFQRTGPPV